MGPVETAIRANIASGHTLHLTSSRKPFRVGTYHADGLELLLGANENSVFLPGAAFEKIPAFLAENGDHERWVRAGGAFRVEGEVGTLDAHLKAYSGTSTSRWVAVVLEAAGLVEVRGNPVRIRAKPMPARTM